jgi:hypothetical protein
MFGHFKSEELMNAVEGMQLSANRQKHLDSCAACASKLRAIEAVHKSIAMEDAYIPEPDWNDFRNNVRLELLSRSVKRESTVRRWTGWAVRPAMAWGLSLVILICVSAGGFWWHVSNDRQQATDRIVAGDSNIAGVPADDSEIDATATAWGRTNLFEDLAGIEGSQAEQVRQLLVSAQDGKLNLQ